MFSTRLPSDLSPNPLARLLEKKRDLEIPVIDLTESNPTRAGFLYPEAEILRALANPLNMIYEPQPRGLEAAREAVAAHFATRGFAVDPERMHLTASTSDAYAMLLKLLTDHGDMILVPRPSYPLVEYLAALEFVQLLPFDLRYGEGRWNLDLDSLEAAYSDDCRAVLVVNPNNPTGSYMTPEEMESLVRFCGERDMALISDEVFFEFPLAASDRLPADRADICSALAAPPEALVFTLGGVSKLLALPQLKLGWIVTGGPDHLVRAALERLDLIADTYLSVNTPVQHAAAELLFLADEIQEPIRRRCAQNLATLRAAAGARHDVSIPDVAAGWYAVLGVDTDISEEDLVFELLDEKDVLAHPGFFFDFSEGSHLVLSLLTPEDAFLEGVTRVLAHLDR